MGVFKTSCLRLDIGTMYDHQFSKLANPLSTIRPHIKWTVSLVVAYGHFNLDQGFVSVYIGKHTYFITPKGYAESGLSGDCIFSL